MRTKGFRRSRVFSRKPKKQHSFAPAVIVIFLVCAAVLFAFAVLLGTHLRKISENTDDTYVPITANTDSVGKFRVSSVPVIVGAAYSPADSSVYPEAEAFASSAVKPSDAVSVVLRTEAARTEDTGAETASSAVSYESATGMHLRYTSALAAARSFDECDEINVNDLFAGAKEKASYVSGLFGVTFQNEPASSRSIIREYEIMLLAELFETGFDDIVLTGFRAENLNDAIDFIRDLESRCEKDVNVGIALEFSFYNSDNVRSIISASGFDCGFLALNLSDVKVPGLMTPAELVSDRVARVASVVSLYSVRVIVGCGTEADLCDEMNAAFKAGAMNIQAALCRD